MSFYTHFKKKCIPEWREYYVSYKTFKQLYKPFKKTSKIYGKIAESKNPQINPMHSMYENEIGEEIAQLRVFEEKFSTLILAETEKADSFFQLKFMDFLEEWNKIQKNAEMFKNYRFDRNFYVKGKMLKNAFQLFYKKVNYLIRYVNLNYDALSKILRKHHKLTKNYTKLMQVSQLKIDDLFKNRYISQNSDSLIQLRDDLTSTYLDLFYHRYNKDKGVKELQLLLQTRIISVWHSYFLFFFLGCTICLLIFIIVMGIDGSINPDDTDQDFKDVFPMFRGSAFIVLYIWLLGWNVYTWMRYQINYKKILEFNYHASTPTEIFMRGTFFSSILLLLFIWYIVVNDNMGQIADGLNSLKIPKEFLPLILWVLLLAYLFFPSKKWFNGEGRLYFFKRIYRWLISPCVMLDGPSGFVADQIMSFVIPLQDLAYTICYYYSRIKNYDDYAPRSCFSDTINVGFLVAFIPGLFRTIHFFYFLKHGHQKIAQKKKEIEAIKKQNILTKKNEQIPKKKETISNEITPPIEEIQKNNENKPNTNEIKSSADSINSNKKNKSIKTEEKKSSGSKAVFSFEEVEDSSKISEQNENDPSSDQPKKQTQEESLKKRINELNFLEASHHLNKMYTACLLISMVVVTFSFLFGKYPDNTTFLIVWVIFAVILSTYAYYLDITKDWSLFQKSKKHPFLRDKLGYQRKSLYYLAIVLDFFLRFVWVFSISPGTVSKLIRHELFLFFMGGFEMFRRSICNFMIIEKIFITNLETYKSLYEYKLPFEEGDFVKIEDKNRSEPIQNKKVNYSVVSSSDFEDDFKIRFRKKKKQEEIKRGLLEDFQGEYVKEEHKDEEEDDKAKTASTQEKRLSLRLNESILKGKEILESFVKIEKDVKNYEDNLNKRYNLGFKDKKQKNKLDDFLNLFNRKKDDKKETQE